jgi:hypothetical protein
MFALQEILLELVKMAYAWLAKRPAIAGLAGVLGLVFILAIGAAVFRSLFFGSDRDPYSYRRVSGEILYEDGQPIPAEALNLTFIPLSPPVSPKLHPRPGFARVDPKTGAFSSATSRKPGDGIAKGAHKVLVSGENRQPLPEDLVPVEYADFTSTPLEVDTKSGRFNLRVKRPVPVPKKTEPKPSKAAAR